jgi:hypothetical protein
MATTAQIEQNVKKTGDIVKYRYDYETELTVGRE